MENNNKLCEICGEVAICLCLKCSMYLCDSCFQFIHEKQRNKNHKKETIDPLIPILLKCPNHPQDRINLFCIEEKGKFLIF